MNKKQYIVLGVFIIVFGGLIFWSQSREESAVVEEVADEVADDSAKTTIKTPAASTPAKSSVPVESSSVSATVVLDNLAVPWELAFLPDGEMLVTERAGFLVHVAPNGTERSIPVPNVTQVGEGGLLGLALHPNFVGNSLFYVYKTTGQGGELRNVVAQYRFNDVFISQEKIIVDNLPASSNHNGGRIAFGPPEACKEIRSDCLLYITTGDAGEESSAQNLDLLAGKILRVKDDGGVPADNPFKTLVWSYGHRNPQGLAWDSDWRMWATEHGRSGLLSGLDELNLIVAGKNYGWPTIQGSATKDFMETPVINSGTDETWAPAGMAVVGKSIFFGGLRGEALYEAVMNGDKVLELKEHLNGKYGRIRIVQLGPDGMLYIGTSNKDGRGDPNTNDDKIIRIDPRTLK